ncbi:MAG: GNAT family protein [Hyphomicrobiales bacterium]
MTATEQYLPGIRIFLRGLQREDLEFYRRWLDDPRVTEFLEMGVRPTRDKDIEAFWKLANDTEDAVVFAIADKKTKKTVGVCGLYLIQWICRRAQFNILIGELSAWDKGFGTEAADLLLDYAFGKLNLNSVQLGVNAENKRAVRSYEKVGFAREGVRRQFIYRNNRYYDMAMMSVLRDDYPPARKNAAKKQK